MIIAVPREIKREEYRVAVTPAGVAELTAAGHELLVESAAGVGSGFSDDSFYGFLINFMVMRCDGVHNDWIDTIAFAVFRAETGVCAILVVVHGFADIVQEAALFG